MRLTLLIIPVVAILFAAPAHADDQTYIGYLDHEAVPYDSPYDALDAGKAVCHTLRSGFPVTDAMKGIRSLGYAGAEVPAILFGATRELCSDQYHTVLEFIK